jgi:hypothetical protein
VNDKLRVSEVSPGDTEEQRSDKQLQECHDLWFRLLEKAFDVSSFDALCTVLRPAAMHDAGWDVLDEADNTLVDFNWMLDIAQKTKGKTPHVDSRSTITVFSWK